MKRLFLSVFLATFVCALAAAQELTIQSIYAPAGLTGRAPDTIEWSPDSKKVSYFLHQEQGDTADLYYIDVTSGKPAVLVTSEKIAAMKPPVTGTKDDREKDNRERYHVAGYHWAPDSEHILFDANGQLWYFTLASGKYVALSAPGESATDPKFSTDGKSVSYIRKHNLVVKRIDGDGEKALTTNGDGNLLNGEVDWVYGEELEVRSNYFWSPDSKKIVLLQMDQTKVPTYPITDFIPQHPTVYQEKYPKVGDPNPQVQLGVVSAGGGAVKWIHLTDDKDMYMPRFGWVNDKIMWATVLNRAQNQLDLYFIDASSGKSRRVLTEKSDTWIETDNNLQFLKSGDKFTWPSWRDGHTHLYLYSFDKANPLSTDAKLVNQITKGDFEVFDIEGSVENTLFVITNAGDDRQRHLCSVKLDGGEFQCLTKGGTHEAKVAPNGQYFIDHFSSLMTPPQLSFCHVGGSCNVFWRSKSVDALNLITPQFVDFKADDGTVLRGIIYLPPDSASKKVPLLNNPYGGPHGQSVRDMWGGANFLFNQILMRDGIAILVVDNRGMGARGKKFAAALIHNFGEVELKDQLASIDQALQKFPQLDGSRMGWWGWSYGGYMTLEAMTHSDRFKAGVAVAPVTDWRDYDSIYTERYAGLVPQYEEGYKKGSPITYAANLKGHLLEVHGTSDDNVHIQNTMQMINAFINAGKQFDLQLYPRKTHSISGPGTRVHLFTRIRSHFRRELLGTE
ncbi:MAG TPA: DPP IV N-terminal domain-containing protein [Candidatus Acidoferrales bacterium]|nr:DPP IV N-terminal domain-containing protein [Candidatus Acidoferrales bacterium]